MDLTQRATCRSQLTKLCNSIDSYLKSSTEAIDEETLNVFLKRLKNNREKLNKADKAVLANIGPEEREKDAEAAYEYDDKAVSMIAKLEFRLKQLSDSIRETSKRETGNGEVHRNESANNSIIAKLKPVEIRKFDGAFENWLPFWEQFRISVHENPLLDAANKFNYLSDALIGTASATIAGFLPTEACYHDAIDLLLEQYGDKEKITERYVQKLMNVKTVQSYDDVKGLRTLYNDMTSTIRTLSALGVAASQYNILVTSIILKSLPASMRVDFHKLRKGDQILLNSTVVEIEKRQDSENQLSKLLQYIKLEVEALEKAALSEQENSNKKKSKEETKEKTKGTAVGLYTTTQKTYPPCIFCKRTNHDLKECRGKMSVNERKQLLKSEGRCFRCGKQNHTSKNCKSQWVKCASCSGRHMTTTCERNPESKKNNSGDNKTTDQLTSTNATKEKTSTALNTVSEYKNNEIYLQTAKAILTNNNNSILSRIVMDNGSQCTYVTEYVAKLLKLPIIACEKTTIVSFGQNKQNKRSIKLNRVILKLKSQYSDKIIEISASVVPSICDDVVPVPNNNILNHRHIAEKISSDEKFIPGINLLIGQDNYWTFNSDNVMHITKTLVAVETFFGLTIQGSEHGQPSLVKCVFNISEHRDEYDITKFWDLESVGIAVKSESEDVELAVLKEINGRYSVSLPWKISKFDLNDNKRNAVNRLNSLTAKLIKNKNKLIEYDNGMREFLNSGIAEIVAGESSDQVKYYMPHRPVYREDKATTKMRIVFDASSSEPGLGSLNDYLSPGKNLLVDLMSILVRFRCHQIAIVADIEKAFLQISINTEDRDCHRFLWYKSLPTLNEELPEVVEYRMTRVTFGVTSSPFLLASTIQQHLRRKVFHHRAVCEKLQQSFYVDDMITSVSNLEEAIDLCSKAKTIMHEGKFNLRKWNTNNTLLKKEFREADHEQPLIHKVLGINWNTVTDEISVDVQGTMDYIANLRPTKRNVMKAMARIYDPLGVLGPFTVSIKILLQKLWLDRIEWDSTLSGQLADEFINWRDDLLKLRNYTIRRSMKFANDSKIELHIFADASPLAYGAVAYIREKMMHGKITTTFLCSKNRVSPVKSKKVTELTLPKLELTAALIASRLADFLKKELDLNLSSINLWTDSTIVLKWITGDGKQPHQYVKSKVNEINSKTNVYDWRHCDGKTNPADLLTRGIKANNFLKADIWKFGPNWLIDENSKWEEKIDNSTSLIAQKTDTMIDNTNIEFVMIIENFSKLQKLIRTTAFVFRFINRCKAKIKNNKINQNINDVDELTFEELQRAENYWIVSTQQKYYASEIRELSKGGSISSKSKIYCLNPVLTDGVLYLTGRLPLMQFENLRNPIILPKEAHLSRLLIHDAHVKCMHCGVNATLTKIRQRFWIVKGRQLIKSILNRCVTCKRLHGKPASEPWTALPIERVATSKAFETTGLDFAGPLYVNEGSNDNQQKVYIMLFTCAAIRGVHLELVRSMTVESCIHALRKFIARREAREFYGAFQEFVAQQGIKWKFIPERAAWWGGFWERLVQTVKNCLKSAIGKAKLNYQELETLLTEVESVINQRPLTYVSNDANDLEPLTPAKFMGDSAILGGENFYTDGSNIGNIWRERRNLIQRYLKRWRVEYLSQLRSVYFNKANPAKSISIGDVVIVKDENQPRLTWKLAVVVNSYSGRDGKTRACDVRLQNQQILRRPIQLLYPLEVRSNSLGPEDVKNTHN